MKNLIWACDPFDSNQGRGAAVSLLTALRQGTKVKIHPTYVLSPASVSIKMILTQSQAKQLLPFARKSLKNSLKGLKIPGLTSSEVILQRSDLTRNSVH